MLTPDFEEVICVSCNGSGQGMSPKSRCWSCDGSGVEWVEKEPGCEEEDEHDAECGLLCATEDAHADA